MVIGGNMTEKENNSTQPIEEIKKPSVKLRRPVETTKILDGFKEHQARNAANPGLDYPVAYGAPVYAAHKGNVTTADRKNDGSGGRIVVLTAGKVQTSYMHLSVVLVKEGDKVEAGQLIGKAGGSGFNNDRHYGTHLHFSLRVDGDSVDPEPLISK